MQPYRKRRIIEKCFEKLVCMYVGKQRNILMFKNLCFITSSKTYVVHWSTKNSFVVLVRWNQDETNEKPKTAQKKKNSCKKTLFRQELQKRNKTEETKSKKRSSNKGPRITKRNKFFSRGITRYCKVIAGPTQKEPPKPRLMTMEEIDSDFDPNEDNS